MNSHIAELRERGLLETQYDDPVQQREAATLGMWVFLSTEILFFGVLFASYTICRVCIRTGSPRRAAKPTCCWVRSKPRCCW